MKWDGHSWSAVGDSFNGRVWTIAVTKGDVYAGGEFTKVGSNSANRVAKWDGQQWTALGGGLDGCKELGCSPAVYALAVHGADVYAGGRFATAGGVASSGVARWTGERWMPLQAGVAAGVRDGVVLALAVQGTSVYAGGTFVTAGATTVNNIAKWSGDSWSGLDGGVRGGVERVHALGTVGTGTVFVGGDFSIAGSVQVSGAAVWDGHQWSGLGIRTHDRVWTIAVDGTTVYFGGDSFTLPSGEEIRGIVKWDGSWSGLGSGLRSAQSAPMSPFVRAISAHGTKVFAAGGPFVFPDAADGTAR
jgi:hypothetical protein